MRKPFSLKKPDSKHADLHPSSATRLQAQQFSV